MSVERPRTLSRREVTAISVGAAQVIRTLAETISSFSHKNPKLPQNKLEIKPVSFSFGDKDLDDVSEETGITPGDFFKFSAKTLDGIKAYTKDELYPIFPPSVMQHKKLIYSLAQEFKTPPNIIAVIMTIESCGNQEAESYVGAQGLFQVMSFHFRPEIRSNPDAMRDPLENGRVGMRYFVNECLPAAKFALKNFPENHPAVYARALMAYNGGPGQASTSFDSLPDETKFYGDHLIRFALTAELADRLRHRSKFTDGQIVQKLSSVEIDARAYALSQFVEGNSRNYSYNEYEKVVTELGKSFPGNPYNEAYKSYKDKPLYKVPVSPGLRIWLNMGGIDMFMKDPRNSDPNSWANIKTSR